MLYLGWIILTAIGVLGSMGVFFWALRSGQFADQGRARYLPLSGLGLSTAYVPPSKLSKEIYVFLFILGIGLLAMASPLILILLRVKG